MKRKSAEAETNDSSKDEARRLYRKIAAAQKTQKKLLTAIESDPSEENLKKLKRVEKAIERDSDKMHLLGIAAAAPVFEQLAEMLSTAADRQDEEELLRLGDEAPAMAILNRIRALRNQFYDSRMIISENETVKEFLRRIDDMVVRYEDSLEERRRRAAARFPALARKHLNPEYEMPALYNEVLKTLVERIEQRDAAAKNLKNAAPNKRKHFQALLAEMDKLIGETEGKLSEIYESYQQRQRFLDGLRRRVANASKTERVRFRQYLKEHPGELPDAEKIMREEFPAENDE